MTEAREDMGPALQLPDDAEPARPVAAPAPQSLAGYRVDQVLVRGHRSIVYRAVRPADGRHVILKAPAAEASDHLEREAAILAGLHHPGVARLMEIAEGDDGTCLVLAYVDGENLEAAFAAGILDWGEADIRELLLDLCGTVGYLHARGILHRDLKTANILRRGDGRAVLVDFDNACRLADSAGAADGPAYATSGYAPPEFYGEGQADGPWSDVYSLGAIAYRAVTGAAPLDAQARASGTAMVPATEAGRDRFSAAFLGAIDQALALQPQRRPQNTAELHRLLALDQGEAQPLADSPAKGSGAGPQEAYPPTLPVQRRPAPPVMPVAHDGAARPRGRAARGGGQAASFVLIFLALALGLAGWQGWPLYQRHLKDRWVVDAAGQGDSTSLSQALELARDGATILVRQGTYRESPTMARAVRLMADPAAEERPVIWPEDGPCLTISAAGGLVSGFRFQGPATSPDVEAPPAACLKVEAGWSMIENNEISHPDGTALVIGRGAAPIVLGNVIAEAGLAGIVVASAAGGELVGNQVSNTGLAGLVVRGGAAPLVLDNRVEQSAGPGLLLIEGAGGRIEANVITGSGGSGVEVRSGAAPTLLRNRIEAAAQAGLDIYDAGAGTYEENEITGSGYAGVVITAGAAPELRRNRIEDSGEHGVVATGSGAALLEDNEIWNNGGHGIAMSEGAGTRLSGNSLKGNKAPQTLRGAIARAK